MPDEMAAADRQAVAQGVPGFTLMRRAGDAVAGVVAQMTAKDRAERRIVVLCGPGNNGGDGFVAARALANKGLAVEVAMLGPETELRGDAATARGHWGGAVADPLALLMGGGTVIVDALFGAGLSRPIEGRAAAVLRQMEDARGQGARVVAVDLPSGVSGASGAVLGAAVKADWTVTFFRRKPGHLLYPGRPLCGRVHVADIGIPETVLGSIKPLAFANAPELWLSLLPVPTAQAHKYDRGHTLVLSGGIEGCGAARLGARAALRVGAGLVTLAVPSEALAAQAAANTAVMVRRADGAEGWAAALADERRNAVVLGPAAGVGDETAGKVLASLGAGRAVVIDADALTSFAERPELLFSAIEKAGGVAVLTPHEGEFARLFHAAPDFVALGSSAARLDKLARARFAARISGAVVVLKGPDTVIAAPDGRAAINENGTSWLATAGSGDTLSGIIGGLLAQLMPAWQAACAGVWLHAQAGASVGPGLIAEDLSEALPAALGSLTRPVDG
jgi:ADP-dependent NAD(P)H-hydrate dehydratase / NAD(P)H-hydrate epimerase